MIESCQKLEAFLLNKLSMFRNRWNCDLHYQRLLFWFSNPIRKPISGWYNWFYRLNSSPFGLEGKRTYKNLCVKCCIRRHTFDSPKSWKICSRQRAKIMQDCINVQSSWNNKDRHLTTKRKKKSQQEKRGKMHAMYVYIAQWTELQEEIRKSQ